MYILDTDTLSHLLRVHGRVTERVKQSTEEVVITFISRIEVLQGRFASVLKAEDGGKLIHAIASLYASHRIRSSYSAPPASGFFSSVGRGFF